MRYRAHFAKKAAAVEADDADVKEGGPPSAPSTRTALAAVVKRNILEAALGDGKRRPRRRRR